MAANLKKKGCKNLANKIKRKIEPCVAAHLLNHVKVSSVKTFDEIVPSIKLIKKHGIEMNRESQVATTILYAKTKLENGLIEEAIECVQSIAVVKNAPISVDDESQEPAAAAADAEVDKSDAAAMPKFDPEAPFARHISNMDKAAEDIDSMYLSVFCTSDHMQTLLENGESTQAELLALCKAFLAAHTPEYIKQLPTQPRNTVNQISQCMRTFGGLLDPTPFAFNCSIVDVEALENTEGSTDDECPLNVFGVIISDQENTFWKAKISAYRRSSFEEATHGAKYNSVLMQLALEPNKGSVDMIEVLKEAVVLYPIACAEFRGTCAKLLENAILESLIKVVRKCILPAEFLGSDLKDIPSASIATLDADTLAILSATAGIAESCQKTFSTKVLVAIDPYITFLRKLNSRFAQQRCLGALTDQVQKFLEANLQRNVVEDSQVPGEGEASQVAGDKKGVATHKPNLKPLRKDVDISDDLDVLVKSVAACSGVDFSAHEIVFRDLNAIAAGVIERIHSPQCNVVIKFQKDLTLLSKVLDDTFVPGGFKAWSTGFSMLQALRQALETYTDVGTTLEERFKKDKDHKAEKALRRAILLAEASKIPEASTVLQGHMTSMLDEARATQSKAEEYAMEAVDREVVAVAKGAEDIKLQAFGLAVYGRRLSH